MPSISDFGKSCILAGGGQLLHIVTGKFRQGILIIFTGQGDDLNVFGYTLSTAEENWSNGRCKTGPLGALQNTALRVVPVVHRRDPRGLRSVRFTR